MNGFLRYGGFLNSLIETVLNCLWTSMLWLICALPVVTLGASSVALYHTVYMVIRKEEGKVWAEFWRSFKNNFKQATAVWLILLLILCFLLASLYNALVLYHMEVVPVALPIMIAVVLAWVIMWGSYLFPCIARFQNTTGQMLKNCSLCVLLHLIWSLLLLIICLAGIVAFLAVPGLFPVIPVMVALLSSYALERVFSKYQSNDQAEVHTIRENPR